MGDFLRRLLGLTPKGGEHTDHMANKLKSLATYFDDIVKATEKSTVIKSVIESAPWWVGATATSAAESFPIIKFVATLVAEKVKIKDPDTLAFLACTLAYQKSIEDVFKANESNKEFAKVIVKKAKRNWAQLDTKELPDFKKFSLENAIQHPFVTSAEAMFADLCEDLNFSKPLKTKLLLDVRHRFVINLKMLLSHGKTAETFKEFREELGLGKEEQAYNYIASHITYNRWLWEESPLFQRDPFALAHVYIDPECGKLTWGDTKPDPNSQNSKRICDPFSESDGGRHDLMECVLEDLARADRKEPIIIQGIAGSGKSSFTLRLSARLSDEGLKPIRIRLRDLSLDRHISEALPEALFPKDKRSLGEFYPGTCDDPFRGGKIFDETIEYRGTKICPYVIILDGWDEISVSVNAGFWIRLEHMLEQVRDEYIKRGVTVVLTGRPSVSLNDSALLTGKTPLFTIRTIKPEQLTIFAEKLRQALIAKPVLVDLPKSEWVMPELKTIQPVFDEYKKAFTQSQRGQQGEKLSGAMEVLGLPLLAYLAMRLMADAKERALSLVQNPTTLLRELTDMVCANSVRQDADSLGKIHSFQGIELRKLLHRTAEAMTVCGGESISYDELNKRLLAFGMDEDLQQQVAEAEEEFDLTKLLIAFFFKGGNHNLGCEFLHKSFREYLFAEAVVEELKEFGRLVVSTKNPLTERPSDQYWQDFSKDDPRFRLSRRLCEMLASQWMTREVAKHINAILEWEIHRVPGSETREKFDQPTAPLNACSKEEWNNIRDGLADMWDWWGEGVHLRPQPSQERNGDVTFRGCYADELVEHDVPFSRKGIKGITPARTTTMDAHLGDAFFRLNVATHFEIACRDEWVNQDERLTIEQVAALWEGEGRRSRRYQTCIENRRGTWFLFAPSGDSENYFELFTNRINGAGWRLEANFPSGLEISGVDLEGARLVNHFEETSFTWCNLSGAKISGWLEGVDIMYAVVEGCTLQGITFFRCTMLSNVGQPSLLSFCFFNRCLLPYEWFLAAESTCYVEMSQLTTEDSISNSFQGHIIRGEYERVREVLFGPGQLTFPT